MNNTTFTVGVKMVSIADLLNLHQRTSDAPFVCEWVSRDMDSSENRAHPPDGETLIATADGWICAYCEFEQPYQASLRERLAAAEALVRMRGFHSFAESDDCPIRLKISSSAINKIAGIYQDLDGEPLPRVEGSAHIDIGAVLDRHRDPRRTEVFKTIDGLPRNERDELAAIIWLGEGTMPDFTSGIANAQTLDEDGGAAYIAGKALHMYLPRGLSLLALEGIEAGLAIEPFKTAAADNNRVQL